MSNTWFTPAILLALVLAVVPYGVPSEKKTTNNENIIPSADSVSMKKATPNQYVLDENAAERYWAARVAAGFPTDQQLEQDVLDSYAAAAIDSAVNSADFTYGAPISQRQQEEVPETNQEEQQINHSAPVVIPSGVVASNQYVSEASSSTVAPTPSTAETTTTPAADQGSYGAVEQIIVEDAPSSHQEAAAPIIAPTEQIAEPSNSNLASEVESQSTEAASDSVADVSSIMQTSSILEAELANIVKAEEGVQQAAAESSYGIQSDRQTPVTVAPAPYVAQQFAPRVVVPRVFLPFRPAYRRSAYRLYYPRRTDVYRAIQADIRRQRYFDHYARTHPRFVRVFYKLPAQQPVQPAASSSGY